MDIDIPERDEAAHGRLLSLGFLGRIVGVSGDSDCNRYKLVIVSCRATIAAIYVKGLESSWHLGFVQPYGHRHLMRR